MKAENFSKAQVIQEKFRQLRGYQDDLNRKLGIISCSSGEYMSVIHNGLAKELNSIAEMYLSHKRLILELEFEKL